MGFLAPLFLAAAAAVALPIALHLLQRERKQTVEFPSLMFLRRIPYQSVRRQRLKHLALLALRCLALVLLALAFARPFLQGRGALITTTPSDAREVVLLVDRSYSMAMGDRWPRAQAAAREVLDGLRDGDRVTLAFFDATAAPAAPAGSDAATVRTVLDAARPGVGVTRYAPALRLAQQVLGESDRPRGEVVLVTDFQRAGWDGAADVRLPMGTAFIRRDVAGDGDGGAANLTAASVELRRERVDEVEQVAPAVRLVNRGDAPATGTATLALNGRTLQTLAVTVPARGAVVAAFAPTPLPPGFARGTVTLAPDALPVDDTLRFVVSRGQLRSALVVAPTGAPARSSLYLTQALALGAAPPWRVSAVARDRVRPADLAGPTLVVVNGAALPDGETGRRLARFVREGGGLIVTLGAGAAEGGAATELLPAVGGVVRREARAATVASTERTHPIFALFRSPRSGDLATAQVQRYRLIRPAATDRVLARFDDGAPALVERVVGRGRVLVLATPLDNSWNDLPLQPVFVPLVHQLARHASGWSGDTPAFTTGEALDVERYAAAVSGEGVAPVDAAEVEWLARSPDGTQATLGGPVGTSLALAGTGFYEVRRVEGRDERRYPVAVNVDPAEADLARLDPAALTVATASGAGAAGMDAAALAPPAQEERQRLWWWALVALLAVVIGEAALGNRLSRARG